MSETYERIQQEARGPGVEEWRQADKARADLSATYQSLRDDPRYTEEHKAQTTWAKYEETRSRVEQLAPEARKKMLRSAESLERMSIPTPEHESLITKDTNKLLLTAHERNRIEGLIGRADKSAKGPFKASPIDVLKAAYEQGLDINAIVNEHRNGHHRGALEDAQAARMRADMVGSAVPKPPFKRGGVSQGSDVGTYRDKPAFIPRDRAMQFKARRPLWK